MAFIEDVLDSHIIAKAMEHFSLEKVDSLPPANVAPVGFNTWGDKAKFDWLLQQAGVILGSLLPATARNQAELSQLQASIERLFRGHNYPVQVF